MTYMIYKHEFVSILSRIGKTFITDAQDFFFFKGKYDWHSIPEVSRDLCHFNNIVKYFKIISYYNIYFAFLQSLQIKIRLQFDMQIYY